MKSFATWDNNRALGVVQGEGWYPQLEGISSLVPKREKIWGETSHSYFSKKDESLVLWVYLEDLGHLPLKFFTLSFSLPAEKMHFGIVPTM